MISHSLMCRVVGLALVATNVAAQKGDSCPTGPGAAFGVLSYQCANCAYRYGPGDHPTYTFYAEPVVLETKGASRLNIGDIIEAVNGKPITTTPGSLDFTYPAVGQNEITVRRGRDRRVLPVTIPAECKSDRPIVLGSSASSIGVVKIRGAAAPLLVVDGVVYDSAATAAFFLQGREWVRFGPPDTGPTSGFGFAVACSSPCTAAEGTEGKTRFTYYKYGVYPPIIAVRPGSPADRAGVRVGDVITKVDGHSVLEDEGAIKLGSVFRKDTIHLTVLRDGKEVGYLINVR